MNQYGRSILITQKAFDEEGPEVIFKACKMLLRHLQETDRAMRERPEASSTDGLDLSTATLHFMDHRLSSDNPSLSFDPDDGPIAFALGWKASGYANPEHADVDIEMLRARMRRRSPTNPMVPDPLADRPFHYHENGTYPGVRCFVDHAPD